MFVETFDWSEFLTGSGIKYNREKYLSDTSLDHGWEDDTTVLKTRHQNLQEQLDDYLSPDFVQVDHFNSYKYNVSGTYRFRDAIVREERLPTESKKLQGLLYYVTGHHVRCHSEG